MGRVHPSSAFEPRTTTLGKQGNSQRETIEEHEIQHQGEHEPAYLTTTTTHRPSRSSIQQPQQSSSAFRRVMRWLKPLRSSKSKNAKLNNGGDFGGTDTYDSYGNPDNSKGGRRRHQNLSLPQQYFSRQKQAQTHQRTPSRDLTKFLPLRVITNILAHVCPHTQDESYESSEESMTLDGCMLCDMRDLAHCALTCKRWHDLAQNLL